MNKPIVLDSILAFRTDRKTMSEAGTPCPDHHNDASPDILGSGAFTRQELRDLVLHWMG